MSLDKAHEDRIDGLVDFVAMESLLKHATHLITDLRNEGFEEDDVIVYIQQKIKKHWINESLIPTREFLASKHLPDRRSKS